MPLKINLNPWNQWKSGRMRADAGGCGTVGRDGRAGRSGGTGGRDGRAGTTALCGATVGYNTTLRNGTSNEFHRFPWASNGSRQTLFRVSA